MANVLAATDSDFASKVLNSSIPVMVDFTASWCQPCKAMAPAVEDLAREYDGEASIYVVDIEQSPAVTAEHGVRAVPSFLVFHRGEVVERITGSASRSKLAAAIDKAIELDG